MVRDYLGQDTIAAIATPPGEGAIGIVRMSGERCKEILTKVFVKAGKRGLLRSHQLYYGKIVTIQDSERVDEVMVSFMAAPRSYTREDMVEIYAHGGPLILRKVLETLIEAGARPAEPGEFTKRAFLNGRIDLVQAEAVLQMIQAKTEQALKWAAAQLSGDLSQCLKGIRGQLVEVLAQMEASLDFPEEELDLLSPKEMEKALSEQAQAIKRLLDTYEQGKIHREGVASVIVGKANVGKSSLFNALVKENRVITSPLPGTTRDFVQETINLNGLPIRLVDTAGLSGDADSLAKEGANRARQQLIKADLVLFVLDRSQPITQEDGEIASLVKGKRGILVLNKGDLPPATGEKEAAQLVSGLPVAVVSALTGEGMEHLKGAILAQGIQKADDGEMTLVITNLRHKEALGQAYKALMEATGCLWKGLPLEIPALHLKEALASLGEIVGEVTSEEILDLIFSQFCVGK